MHLGHNLGVHQICIMHQYRMMVFKVDGKRVLLFQCNALSKSQIISGIVTLMLKRSIFLVGFDVIDVTAASRTRLIKCAVNDF